jgi:hypothetical protein
MSDNGRLKKLVAVVDGKEEKHPEGQYKVRWLESGKPRFDSVGNDPDAALMALNRRKRRWRQLQRVSNSRIQTVSNGTESPMPLPNTLRS